MNLRKTLTTAAALLVLLALISSATGCVIVRRVEREDRTDRTSVEIEGADEVEALIRMGAGKLSVDGERLSAQGLLDAEFTYDRDSWKPDVDYEVVGDRGKLEVRQPSRTDVGPFGGDYRYEWDLALSDDVPMSLDVEIGAGETQLDLSELDLRDLKLSFGAGDATVDLRGAYDHDVDVSINGGAGSMTLYLPEDVGVRVNIDQGIGEIVANGFRMDGSRYVNDAYDDADTFIDVEIDAGVGQITLILDDSESSS